MAVERGRTGLREPSVQRASLGEHVETHGLVFFLGLESSSSEAASDLQGRVTCQPLVCACPHVRSCAYKVHGLESNYAS